jgi:very-short-patch-repair endonuclease
MVERNPMHTPGIREKASASVARTWSKKLTPCEDFLAGIFGDRATPQFCFGKYVMDLAFVPERIDLEIDGKNHGFGERKSSDKIRDAWLISNGWSIARVNRDPASRPWHLVDVLKNLIPDLQLSTELPCEDTRRGHGKYWVFVRSPQNPTGCKL